MNMNDSKNKEMSRNRSKTLQGMIANSITKTK